MYEASKYLQAINKTKKSFFQRGLRIRDYLHGRRARMAAIIVTLNRIQHVPFYVNRIDSSAAQEYNESFCGRYKYNMCNNDTNSSKLIALRNTRDE
ncbi:hypothetical protein ALC56_05437 [Trachymyrmex septentrionalis]|uniref:Uncharacterized protein n=1 Tax=Trachymyrmex septentrionalis TaxID=34720 RepID=A0A195FJQ7_9HYME|nr:hypothetical protein ALC56_05437 [Trachymyrmex septentrionalis]